MSARIRTQPPDRRPGSGAHSSLLFPGMTSRSAERWGSSALPRGDSGLPLRVLMACLGILACGSPAPGQEVATLPAEQAGQGQLLDNIDEALDEVRRQRARLETEAVISQQVVNYTLSDQKRRLELRLGVAYGSDLDHARATIEEAVRSVDNVMIDPEPKVHFQGFGDSSLDFQVLFWIPSFDLGLETRSAVGMAIHRALRREEIEVPFPQRDVHLRTTPP